MADDATFGQALRRMRLAAGLSQPELARRVPLSQSSLSRYESDSQHADPATALRLDELLGANGTLMARLEPTSIEILSTDDRARLAHTFAHPSRIDGRSVTALAGVLAAQRRLDDVIGPQPLIPPTAAQAAMVTGLLKNARGPHRDELAKVAAEYVQFEGWLHAEARNDVEAVRALTIAEDLADDARDGTLAAQAANFRGYLARQQGRPGAVVRWFLTAHHTPGAHPAQRLGDAAQAAHGYAALGEADEARRLLDVAGGLLDDAARDQPPGTAYWLKGDFHRLNIGLAHLALGDHADAADHIAAGLAGLPADQQGAEWTIEYRDALDQAQQAS
ncbi:helix-turn-helix transcriptional regulator [Kibdelosporangium persicum]|uniref:Transcriptional regulator n=1 Tax=Kibdelosporangium persicum TaxID=2698649 RepID=A0ABX2F4B4_9PSEU|nr:helix-turn-helix transcriptional regulator [Kibdelosporangium persicum]NRN66156.1 Transcriptional regulator [Kibdelosporangium persicum]